MVTLTPKEQDEVKYSTSVGSLNRPTRRKVLRFIDKKMKSMTQVISSSQKQNQKLSFAPIKFWFELLTNIPKDVKEVIFEIEKIKNEGFVVRCLQPGPGTTLEIINENMIDDEVVESQNFKVKDNKSGSIYGSGISTQSQYTSELVFKVKTPNCSTWNSWDVHTGDVWEEESQEIESGVIIESFIPYSQKMLSYERYIEDLRWLISLYDNRNIQNGRTYTIKCTGFGTGADDRLSTTLQPTPTVWILPNGKVSNLPSFNNLSLNGKLFDKLPLIIPTDEGDKTVLLDNFRLGKRDNNYRKSLGDEEWKKKGDITGDIPYLIVYYKNSDQIAFMLPLRGNSGLTSLNNVILEADISKDDLRPFFTSTDKFGDIDSLLKSTLFKELRQYLLDRYPDNDLLERAIQLWLYEVIVNDFGGKFNADNLRKEYGWEFLNSMTPKQRTDFVIMEYDSDEGRQDFRIFLVNETNGKITKFTKSCIIEVKRNDFTKKDRQQSMGYITTTVNATQIVGVSLGIKAKNDTGFKQFFAKANGTGQLSNNIRYDLMEVSQMGFVDDVQDKFTSLALLDKK